MQNFLIYSNLIVGFWLIFCSFIMNTGNMRSTIFFKTIPFFMGLALLFNGLKLLHLI